MYKRVKIKKLGRTRSHRKALIQNQLRSLFSTGKVKTTTVKAKVLLASAQSIISDAKSVGSDISRSKKLADVLGSRLVADNVIAYANSTEAKITLKKVGFRDGDNAEVSRVEAIGYKGAKKPVVAKKKSAKKVEVKKKENARVGVKKENKSPTKVVKESFSATRKQRATSRSGL